MAQGLFAGLDALNALAFMISPTFEDFQGFSCGYTLEPIST